MCQGYLPCKLMLGSKVFEAAWKTVIFCLQNVDSIFVCLSFVFLSPTSLPSSVPPKKLKPSKIQRPPMTRQWNSPSSLFPDWRGQLRLSFGVDRELAEITETFRLWPNARCHGDDVMVGETDRRFSIIFIKNRRKKLILIQLYSSKLVNYVHIVILDQ